MGDVTDTTSKFYTVSSVMLVYQDVSVKKRNEVDESLRAVRPKQGAERG